MNTDKANKSVEVFLSNKFIRPPFQGSANQQMVKENVTATPPMHGQLVDLVWLKTKATYIADNICIGQKLCTQMAGRMQAV